MQSHLQKLLFQTKRYIPQFYKCLQYIPNNNFQVNYPLQLIPLKSKCIFPNYEHFLQSINKINPNNHIFFIQSNEFFSSSNFAGATTVQQDTLNDRLMELKQKYEIFDSDMINRIKLTLSVHANLLDQQLHLNKYAKFILKSKKPPIIQNFIKTHSNSGFLKSVINSNKLATSTTYQYLHKSFLKAVKPQEFNNSYQLVRYYSKQTNKLRVIFPFSNHIQHSFQPNCQLKAMFLTHRRKTFLTLQSVKQIQPGQMLTINYGNQNNYQFFIRYGFTIPDNPFSQFYLPIDFSQIQDTFNANIDWKMQMFKKNKNLKLKNFVKINSNGRINNEDLNMLKIVFSKKPLNKETFTPESQQSKALIKQIQQFVKTTGHRFSKMMQKLEQKKKLLKTQSKQNSILTQSQQSIQNNINIIQNQQKNIIKKLNQLQ